MQETDPNRLDEHLPPRVALRAAAGSAIAQGTADSYAPQIRVVKGDVSCR